MCWWDKRERKHLYEVFSFLWYRVWRLTAWLGRELYHKLLWWKWFYILALLNPDSWCFDFALVPYLSQNYIRVICFQDHLKPLPCLSKSSGAGTRMVSSLGGEMIKGAGVPWNEDAITWNTVNIRKQEDFDSGKVKLSCSKRSNELSWSLPKYVPTTCCCPLVSHAFMLHCSLVLPHSIYRDVNLATGWNNVRKRQVVMIYPQAMVASIESQLQHLSDDDDSSSLSAREERRLTRPQATAPLGSHGRGT